MLYPRPDARPDLCVFCGAQPIGCRQKDHSGEFYVYCERCRAEGPPADSVEDAYLLWAQRMEETTPP